MLFVCSHSFPSQSTLGRLLDPITQDSCAFYEDHAVYNEFTGVVFGTDEGERIGKVLGNKKAVILQNHGLLTVGQSVEAAAWWFVSMERCCQSQLLAEAVQKPTLIPAEVAIKTRGVVGTPYSGWFSFQPMYDRIVLRFPDLKH